MQPPNRGGFQFPQRRPNKGKTQQNIPNKGNPPPKDSHPGKPTAKDVLQQEAVFQPKQFLENFLTIAHEDLQLQIGAWGLKERYLGNHNYMTHEGKPRFAYEAILIETGSVQIEHFHLQPKDIKSAITHSKCYIVKVLHATEWELNLAQAKTLKATSATYNYWDYIKAWQCTFYYQNPLRKHTWLFVINDDICTKNFHIGFPLWF